MENRLYRCSKYRFKPEEIQALGEALARESLIVCDLQEQKATAAATFAAEIKAATKRVGELVDKITCGFEMRETECLVFLETPRPGMKRIVRIDDDEIVAEEPMTAAERQGDFGFRDQP